MSDDDDWFEQALREDADAPADEESATTESESDDSRLDEQAREERDGDPAPTDPESEPDAETPADVETARDVGSSAEPAADNVDPASSTDEPAPDSDEGRPGTDEGRPGTDEAHLGADEAPRDSDEGAPGESTPDIGADAADTAFGSDETTESEPASGSEDENPFDQDFATALENAPDPGTDGPSGPGDGANGASSAGSAPDDPFGFGGGESGDDAFGFGGGGEFEGDAFGGGAEEEFDEAAFDSDLERLDVGIGGLDDMILGGVPRRSLMVAVGSAGTGKTTFGLQFLNHGLENGESAVYITLEESHDRILDTAAEKGWDFENYVDEDRLAVVDIDPIEMANSLDSIQNDLPDLIEEFGADRLVLDSVSLLEMMYESAPKRRSQVFGFTRALKNAGITTLLTSEASEDNPYTSRFGIVEYLADAVFVLQYVRGSDFRETRLAIEIQKIRDANHSRATKPYELTESGISVYRQANIF
ncbi:KaiC domain-containing protein [Halobellus litoreus]|uniref:KaiC domain-containing protein n=1 Tax=Halobellus litoreus TaxID=755310 RepID=A0ABD6DTL8_9EURY